MLAMSISLQRISVFARFFPFNDFFFFFVGVYHLLFSFFLIPCILLYALEGKLSRGWTGGILILIHPSYTKK